MSKKESSDEFFGHANHASHANHWIDEYVTNYQAGDSPERYYQQALIAALSYALLDIYGQPFMRAVSQRYGPSTEYAEFLSDVLDHLVSLRQERFEWEFFMYIARGMCSPAASCFSRTVRISPEEFYGEHAENLRTIAEIAVLAVGVESFLVRGHGARGPGARGIARGIAYAALTSPNAFRFYLLSRRHTEIVACEEQIQQALYHVTRTEPRELKWGLKRKKLTHW